MLVKNIAALNLHDSTWISTLIRTTDQGDENIILELDYLLDYTEFETERWTLTFVRCWGARSQMNFRFSGPDSISLAEEHSDSDFIKDIEKTWAAINPVQVGRLRHFVITAGLTGSQLEVVAEELHLSISN